MVVQVQAIAYIAINLGFKIFTLLNSLFPDFLSFCNLCVCMSVYVLDLYVLVLSRAVAIRRF